MARTKTQKALRKAERSGTWCAAQSRRLNSDYGAISQHVRLTPSKQEQLNKNRYKGQIFQDDAPFLLAI
ncbi:hypothetical protein BSK62_08285 [Paenibacillus odorifer]|uniref:hypothetical protein n=1 Tax=Paenibacillus TaxID=44249 RepID=UPI00096D08C3|nr:MULTISPECIES: hypothetical protein [Paenibacillus]MDH6426921.1 NAD(P)H-nitrite reductase large subunit [Paenibacillus sp. PastH-4]MDH6442949.1 NAD(P)H-nitrite reductase large subunit [Paenibacillus sp. PastF-4]MDH6526343.1 NAD(P)H-nitrite reductase large subunit [Paenibacillus sp. PastH-3]OMD67010.1 hypothetical protein BSK62_08285 [Paenibacillus odorifer]